VSEAERIESKRERVLAKCRYFKQVGVWSPLSEAPDPEQWLTNFSGLSEDDQSLALDLLDSFMYFGEDQINQLFYAAVQFLSHIVTSEGQTLSHRREEWRRFLDAAIITSVTDDERPSVTDSGIAYARKARRVLEIGESQIIAPDKVLAELYRAPRDVIFVDDFVGTGTQFVTMWMRPQEVDGVGTSSWADFAKAHKVRFFYCPALAHELGLKHIDRNCPVRVSPGNVIQSSHGALGPDSRLWPVDRAAAGIEFVRRVSLSAGIPDTDGAVPNDWRGFGKLGLALGLHNLGPPDATLALFRWEDHSAKSCSSCSLRPREDMRAHTRNFDCRRYSGAASRSNTTGSAAPDRTPPVERSSSEPFTR